MKSTRDLQRGQRQLKGIVLEIKDDDKKYIFGRTGQDKCQGENKWQHLKSV